MACPDIFLGIDPSASPPHTFWENLAITPGEVVTSGNRNVHIIAANKGNAPAEGMKARVYWSPPTTGFIRVEDRKFGDYTVNLEPAAMGPDGEIAPGIDPENVVFQATNARNTMGHAAFLAQLWMPYPPGGNCPQQTYDGNDPAHDPRTAIWNIQITEHLPSMGPKMYYGFAASNPLFGSGQMDTELTFRQLNSSDPNDHHAIDQLTSHTGIAYKLASLGVTEFAPSQRVRVRRGVQQATAPMEIGPLGPIARFQANRFGVGHWRPIQEPFPIELQSREQVQMLLEVEPSRTTGVAHAVQITHSTCERRFGGITLVFVPRRTYY